MIIRIGSGLIASDLCPERRTKV